MSEETKTEVKGLYEDPAEMTIEEFGPVESITEGSMISLVIGLLIGGVIYTFTNIQFNITNQLFNIAGSVVCGFFVAVWFFAQGVRTPVQTSFLAAIKFADERIYSRQITEGWVWLFPWILSYKEVSAIEETIIVGTDKDLLEILAVKKKEEGLSGDEDLTRDIVELIGKVLIRIRVWNAPLSLGFEKSEVEKNIVNYVNSTLRQIASETSYLEFVTNKYEIANSVFRCFKRTLHESEGGNMLTYSQQIELMGYRVGDVEFVKVDLPKNVKDAMAKKTIEYAQREGEMTDVDTLIMGAQRLMEKFPGLGNEEALDLMQVAQGKAKKQVIKGARSIIATTEGGEI
jgi:regulator of protease activity HflC (stomatin/prohibitin superfamily)